MDDSPHIKWIADGLKRLGKSQSDLARHLGIAPSQVNRMLKGTRRLQIDEMPKVAEFLGESAPETPELTEVSLSTMVQAQVAGTVEAGAFREIDDLGDLTEAEEVWVPRDRVFPNARMLVFDVAGDSMNALRPRSIQPGDRIVCVAYEDVAHSMPYRDGMVVVVERLQMGGHMREWSVKQLEVYDDHYELHPRSTAARHKPIIVPKDFETDDGMTVEIIGLVRQVMNDIPVS